MPANKILKPPVAEIVLIIVGVLLYQLPGSSTIIGKVIHPAGFYLLLFSVPALLLSFRSAKMTAQWGKILLIAGIVLVGVYLVFRFATNLYYGAVPILVIGGALLIFSILTLVRIRLSVPPFGDTTAATSPHHQ